MSTNRSTDGTDGSRLSNKLAPAVLAAMLALATGGIAATSQTGSISAGLNQLVEIKASDSSVALGSVSPTSGSDSVAKDTSDVLKFTNGKSNVQAGWDYGISVDFTKDADGSTITDSSVSYQGTSAQVQDLLYVADTSTGNFTEWEVATDSDLTGNTGWTSHADCGAVDYQGDLMVDHFDNNGAKQTAAQFYYQVCDSSSEIYVDTDKDVSDGDKAIVVTQASAGSTATEANYELSLLDNDYIFYSAGSATTVTVRQGHHVNLGTDTLAEDERALLELPDGFPAGSFSVTLTASASDINTN